MKNKLKILSLTCTGMLLLLSGCASPTSVPNEYRLGNTIKVIQVKKTPCSQKRLKVNQALSDTLFFSLKMYYVKGKYAQYAYSRSRWAQTPNSAITEEFTHYLRARKLFKSVQSADSQTKNDLLLEINIEDFMQYFDESEKHSFVKAIITCSLIDANTHKTVTTKTFHVKISTKSDDAHGGVVALNTALERIVQESAQWLEEVCFDK